MRVAIDVRKLHDFGIGTYIRNIVRELARFDRETDYVLICQDADREAARSLGENFRTSVDRKSTRLNSSHCALSRMPSSA